MEGANIDHAHAWVVQAPSRPIRLASAFRLLISERGMVVLEGVSIDPEFKQMLRPYVTVPALEIRPGTIYPSTEWLHLGATSHALRTLEQVVNMSAGSDLCNHLYAYENGALLLKWHDAFSDPIYLAGTLSSPAVNAFCAALSVGSAKPPLQRVP